MGYRIEYGQMITKVKIKENVRKTSVEWLLKVVATGCVLLFLAFLWGKENIRDYFIPGDPDITEQAAKCFLEDVRNGESIKDAFTNFCLEIIENEGVPE